MAKVTYKAGPDGPKTVQWGGQTLEDGKSVDITNPALLAKAEGNPYFEVSGASKDEQRQMEVVGGYADANTGEEVSLIRTPRRQAIGTGGGGPTGPVPPSAATQGSTATIAAAQSGPASADVFAETYGASQDEVASGEYEGAPEYQGPQGTEGSAKRGPGRPRKGE